MAQRRTSIEVDDELLAEAQAALGTHEAIRADLATGAAVDEGIDIFSNVEALAGTPFDDLLLGDGGPNSLFGGDGNDTLRGRAGGDYLVDGFGVDRLFGGRGPDLLGRGDRAGGDSFDGNRGTDTCEANPDDVLRSASSLRARQPSLWRMESLDARP